MKVLDRAQSRIPQPWRTIVDWFVTVAAAFAFVLAFQAQVAKPYRIPSASMEPTLHCARPTAFCQGRFSDRVIANRLAYRFSDPKRGQIVVFRAPETAGDAGSVTEARPSSSASSGFPASSCRNGTASSTSTATVSSSRTSTRLWEVTRRQVAASHAGSLLRTRRQPDPLLRLPHLGNGASRQPGRPGDAHVLAAQPRFIPLVRRRFVLAPMPRRLRRAQDGGDGNRTRLLFPRSLHPVGMRVFVSCAVTQAQRGLSGDLGTDPGSRPRG